MVTKSDFDQDNQQNLSKYFNHILKIFLLVSLSCMILNYIVIIALTIDNAKFNEWLVFTFDFVLYSRIISDILILILWIHYIWNRWYKISKQFISNYVHWLDPISFKYFCNNNMDKNYGMKFIFHCIYDYCYFIDIYMNNYIIYQTLCTLQICKGNLVYSVSNDILNILISYLWFHPNYKKINKNKKSKIYDASKLKSMVSDKQSELLLRLNELISIKDYNNSKLISLTDEEKEDENSESDNYQNTNKRAKKDGNSDTKYNALQFDIYT